MLTYMCTPKGVDRASLSGSIPFPCRLIEGTTMIIWSDLLHNTGRRTSLKEVRGGARNRVHISWPLVLCFSHTTIPPSGRSRPQRVEWYPEDSCLGSLTFNYSTRLFSGLVWKYRVWCYSVLMTWQHWALCFHLFQSIWSSEIIYPIQRRLGYGWELARLREYWSNDGQGSRLTKYQIIYGPLI